MAAPLISTSRAKVRKVMKRNSNTRVSNEEIKFDNGTLKLGKSTYVPVVPPDVPVQRSHFRVLIPNICLWQLILPILNGEWIFRGQSNSVWELDSGSERNLKIPQLNIHVREYERKRFELERSQLREFKKLFNQYFRRRAAPSTVIGWMAQMQHYGIPTRMLDFTKNIHVAMFMGARSALKANAFSIWAVKRLSLGRCRITSLPNDNDAFVDFLSEDKGGQLERFDEWKDKIALIDDLQQCDINANWRISAQEGLFLAPAYFSYASRSILSERLIGSFVLGPLMRSPYFGSAAYPSEMSIGELKKAIATYDSVEFVFPSGVRPLMMQLAIDNQICDQNMFPDSGLVDSAQMRSVLAHNNFESHLGFSIKANS